MDAALQSRCDDLAPGHREAKATLSPWCAYSPQVIIQCTQAPAHPLRSSPCAEHPTLTTFDLLQKSGISHITNSALSDTQWLQASLPVRDGGLGMRRVASRWHLLPSWHQLRALRIFRTSFLQVAVRPMTLPSMLSAPCGFHCTTSRVPSIQLHWDRPHGTSQPSLRTLPLSLTATIDSHDRARLLASMAPHSGDWLHALPISSCGLRLDDEAIRVAVGLRLGINLCQPHQCPCGTLVDARGTHGLACRRSSGRMARHHNINDLIYRGLIRAGVPSTKEPSGLSRTDGKRPDGLTLIPWQCGKSLIWDVTVADTLAASHLATTSVKAGSAADTAAVKKDAKYADLARTYHFVPIACETLGPLNSTAINFLSDLGKRIAAVSGDSWREG